MSSEKKKKSSQAQLIEDIRNKIKLEASEVENVNND